MRIITVKEKNDKNEITRHYIKSVTIEATSIFIGKVNIEYTRDVADAKTYPDADLDKYFLRKLNQQIEKDFYEGVEVVIENINTDQYNAFIEQREIDDFILNKLS